MFPILKIQYSKKLLYFAMFLYSSAGIATMMSAIPWYCKLAFLLLLMTNARLYFVRHIFLTDHRAVIAIWQPNPAFWSLQMANQQIVNAYLLPNNLVTHFLTVLNFKSEDNLRLTVIITPESVEQDAYRKLLAHLYHAPK